MYDAFGCEKLIPQQELGWTLQCFDDFTLQSSKTKSPFFFSVTRKIHLTSRYNILKSDILTRMNFTQCIIILHNTFSFAVINNT